MADHLINFQTTPPAPPTRYVQLDASFLEGVIHHILVNSVSMSTAMDKLGQRMCDFLHQSKELRDDADFNSELRDLVFANEKLKEQVQSVNKFKVELLEVIGLGRLEGRQEGKMARGVSQEAEANGENDIGSLKGTPGHSDNNLLL